MIDPIWKRCRIKTNPDIGKYYLVYNSEKVAQKFFVALYHKGENRWDCGDIYGMGPPTHWMELPETPR